VLIFQPTITAYVYLMSCWAHILGHNGLVAAAYMARGGKSVCVLEKRHVLGGAAVTEEIIPGEKFVLIVKIMREAV